ncbi:MAG: bifunctional phosphoribosyl-AMP cyclohydrolase/phosphoribosyl-ATP diphosphatase HisIE [Synergistaceae bacterium]
MKINTELIKYDEKGLIPVIVQDATTGENLMLAYANEESIKETEQKGELVFWSRSRQEIWHKGATSGNTMKIKELKIDCDGDTILAIVEPSGPACHTGERTCFNRTIAGENTTEATFLGRLWNYLNKRKNDSPEESYTASLLQRGASRVGQKVGEEGVETALACATNDKPGFRYEAADLLYHLLVACISVEVPLNEVLKELASRHKEK